MVEDSAAVAVRLTVARIQLAAANAVVDAIHRHHGSRRGHVFSIAAAVDGAVVGVAITGRPSSRGYDPLEVAEVTRLATDGTPNACSFLYGASARAARALGYRRIITYTLATEPGTSLRAAGFTLIAIIPGRSWSCASRPRIDKHPTTDKHLWAREL